MSTAGRFPFGAGVADFATKQTGAYLSLAAGAVITMWTAQTGGTQITDLLAADGVTAITSITTLADGTLPSFYGPATGLTVMWANGGGAELARIQSDPSAAYAPIPDTQSLAFIDFTTKANGAAPTVMDTGQAVTSTHSVNCGAPVISGGRLVATVTGNTALADYFQVPLGANGKRVGAEWTMAGLDSGFSAAAIILWDHVYLDNGDAVPQARAHVVIIPGGTPTWEFWVCDGTGHLVEVASGTFTAQAIDGVTRWRTDVEVDEDTGNVYLWVPDESILTVTAAQIAAAIAGTSGWSAGTTLKSLSGLYATVEHFATGTASSAQFPAFTAFWSESSVLARGRYRSVSPAAMMKAIQATKVGTTADPGWTAPTMLNSWVATGGTEQPGYRKLPNGLVEIRGFITGGTGSVACYTLPVGYRPPTTIFRAASSSTGASGIFFSISGTSGNVVIQGATGGWIDAIFDTTA